jgi:hypothetical protein
MLETELPELRQLSSAQNAEVGHSLAALSGSDAPGFIFEPAHSTSAPAVPDHFTASAPARRAEGRDLGSNAYADQPWVAHRGGPTSAVEPAQKETQKERALAASPLKKARMSTWAMCSPATAARGRLRTGCSSTLIPTKPANVGEPSHGRTSRSRAAATTRALTRTIQSHSYTR